jgi:hypothetical protein
MAKTKQNSGSEEVTAFIKKANPDTAKLLEALRQVILNTDKDIAEQIKWNAPSFYYNGEMKAFDAKEYKRDIVVYNLHKKEYVLLVFPTGAKINDSSGLLEGDYKDGRRLAKIFDLKDLKTKEKNLQKVIKVWLSLVEK